MNYCGLLMFFIRSRKWVAFSSGLISDVKQKAGEGGGGGNVGVYFRDAS